MSLVRTPDLFFTNLAKTVPLDSPGIHKVSFFNPGSNTNKVSSLRLVNDSDRQGSVTISGVDDAGNPALGGNIQFNIAANQAMLITAQDLENGNSELGLVGTFGDGEGKWRLQVTSDVALTVQSLLTTTNFLTNISRAVEQASP